VYRFIKEKKIDFLKILDREEPLNGNQFLICHYIGLYINIIRSYLGD